MHLNHATAVSAAAMVNYQHYAPAQITTSHGVTTSSGQQQTTISAAGLQQAPFTLHQLTAVQAIQHPTHQAMLHPQHPLVHLLDISTTAAASSSLNNNPAPITPMPVTKIEMPEEIVEPIIDDPRKKKQCHICKNKFRQLTTLRNHMKIHTDERPYKCKHCDKAFRQISTLTNHVKIHTGEKPFKCNICSKDFRQQSTLINHIKTHKVFASLAESNQTPAAILNYQTQQTQGTSRKGHSKTIVHSAAAAAAQAQLIHQQQMQQQQQQQQQQQGQGTIVTYTPQQRQNITKSLYTGSYNSPQADELVKPYQCKICQKRFPQLSTLHNHERTHIDPKPYKCDTCEKSFSQLATLANHKKIHSGDKPYACAYCCMTFRQQSTLNNHMKTHANQVATITTNSTTAGTGGGGSVVQVGNHHHPHHHQAGGNNIPLAAATIMVTPTASGHLQIQPQVEHHPLLHFLDSNTTVSTLSTKEQFATVNNNNTTNNNHNNTTTTSTGVVPHCLRNSCPDRPFMCSVCRRTFSQQSTLTNHLKTHTGEKPYKCKICESHFRQLSTLNNHMKIHTGEKPYACSYCPKQFRQKSTLTNHVRIHTG
ncbi:zinc finger protein 135 isoform X2 [Lucilia sericata]|uniref:zinc finger protein 135 isoform X2 n=1 Tax=Lucilia sericata TaxID=13632 RepID=UPI0018A7FC51|nr:zinc finger protein 135 isoform X2 [Lucilia sericata]